MSQGIDSISLNPDSVLKTMLAIVEAEKTIATSAQAHRYEAVIPAAAGLRRAIDVAVRNC